MALDKSKLSDLKLDRDNEDRGGLGWLLWLILVVALTGGGFWAYQWSQKNSAMEVSTVAVRRVVTGERATVLNATGYVEPRRLSTISSKVTGKITEVLVEEGMKVTKNQILARIDTTNIDASLRLAKAQLEVSRTAIKETEVRKREADLDLKRVAKLVKEGISTQAELDSATAAFDAQVALLARQKEEIKVSQRQIEVWEQELEDRVVRAPFDGVVVSKNAQPGEMISPMSSGGFTRTGICTIVDMSSLEIEVDVNEAYINRVQPGMPVEAKLDAYQDWKIPCKVIAIIPTADRSKATVKVRIGFNELDPRMLPDMGAKVAFQSVPNEAEPTVQFVVPSAAVAERGGREVVFLINNGLVERRAVALGDEKDGEVTVLAGVNGSDTIISPVSAGLKSGIKVKETTE
ncbi:MAG: efflux transporter periplasmic adaptor subunit [Verrucomicrobiales bacterium]|nr:efflux transporter periplasmic adaptor subunit [Verrucomicrobiales bacterium]|tara:strand:+ start:3537 stop:4751 length:1215 start_codon:yes stop_codon:yes gene_type:complete